MSNVSRNRIIYQSQAVYAGPDKSAKGDAGWRVETGQYAPLQLKRVQSANYSFDIARTDVNQFGELAAIDRVVLESPTVSFDTSWYACNWYNEDVVGLFVNPTGTLGANANTGILSDILTSNADERNYYIRVVPEGEDAVGYDNTDDEPDHPHNDAAASATIGIGNGFMSNWSMEGAVGGFPTASMSVEALNIAFYSGISGNAPWVFASNGAKSTGQAADADGATHNFVIPEATQSGSSTHSITAIKPGNINITLPDPSGGANVSGIAVQSFNVGFDLAREPLNKLGSRFAFTREITFPITATCSVDCLVGDFGTGNLSDIINNNVDNDVVIGLKETDDATEDHMRVYLRKAKLDSQSFSQGIGDNQTVTLNWSTQVGSKTQSGIGLFLSGNKA